MKLLIAICLTFGAFSVASAQGLVYRGATVEESKVTSLQRKLDRTAEIVRTKRTTRAEVEGLLRDLILEAGPGNLAESDRQEVVKAINALEPLYWSGNLR